MKLTRPIQHGQINVEVYYCKFLGGGVKKMLLRFDPMHIEPVCKFRSDQFRDG